MFIWSSDLSKGINRTGTLDETKLNYIKALIRGRVPQMPDIEFTWELCRRSLSKCCQSLSKGCKDKSKLLYAAFKL